MAIETAIQNGGIGVVVLNLTFPSPYSDMALMPILAFFFCSAGPFLFLCFVVKEIVQKLRRRGEARKEDDQELEGKRVVGLVASPHVTKFHRVSTMDPDKS